MKLLDNLCSMSDLPQGSTPAPEGGGRREDGDEEGEVIQRVTAFQVLADRYVSWEGHIVGSRTTGFVTVDQSSLMRHGNTCHFRIG